MNVGGTVIIPSGSDVLIEGNHSNIGGGFCLDGANATIEAGVFRNNNATDTYGSSLEDPYPHGFGGAIHIQCKNNANTHTAVVSISGANFINNSATKNGGAIYLQEVTAEHDPPIEGKNSVSISNCTFTGNRAIENDGGAIYINDGELTIAACDIRNNEANLNGGAIYFDATSTMTVGSGTMTIKDNTCNSVPNNVYLVTDNIIDIAGDASSFNPVYVGIYPQGTATVGNPIHVFSGTNEQVTTIYSGMTETPRTKYVVDDSQRFSPLNPGSGTTFDFGSSPWSPLQQTVRKETDLDPIYNETDEVYEISNVKQLTAYLWYVNGINTHDSNFSSIHSGAKGKLMADIDMEDHHWESIANYTGTFDGNGYTISHLSMVPTNPSDRRGMFGTNTSGTIKNVILRDSYMAASTGYVGIVVCQNNGTLCNSVAEGEMVAAESGVIMGGLAGLNGGTIHSSFATPEMYGYTMGGLVGKNTSNLFNSFANAKFTNKGSGYMGGLVGVNTGRVENCYSRLQGDAPASNFGWLVGNNTDGTVNYCYIPDGQSTYKAIGNNPSYHGTYGTTSIPYLYNHRDNQITLASGTSPYVSSQSGADKQMLIALNNWVTANGATTYTYWLRTTTKTINDDLPLLRLPATNAVAATNGEVYLDYNQVNDLLTAYTTATKAICLYGAEASMDGNASSTAPLYIDQEATLKQSGSKGAINARTSQMLETYEGEGKERWHHFSSPLTHSDIGFTYNNASPVPFDWGLVNPCGVEINGDDDHSLFPSNLLTATTFNSVDLFCFYEPEYHWLNLKRASDSHWHMNATEEPIAYNGNGIGASTNGNETYLVPGKGYLVSVDVNQLVQNYGTLNDGNVTLYRVTKTDDNAWAERLGFNLLGNPYQSYLDFEAFKTQNGTSLWASDADIYEYTYAVFDPKLNAYRQYKDGSSVFSNAASRYIHPHQGFFIRMTQGTNSSTTVTYTNDMRVVTLPENVTSPYRGEAQPAFPLINLVVSDSEGNADLAVLELDRAHDEGAEKIRLSECKGMLSLGYENRDYSILFRTKIEDYQPLRFEALEEGTFTLEWNTANGEFSELTLIDNIAGTTTDMLSRDSYSFEANPDQYVSRFKIVIGHYKDIDEYEDAPSTGSGTFAFQMGDELVVNGEGSLQMFDVTGRLVMKQTINGTQSAIALPDVAKGVYVLRLTGKTNGTQTQKIVIQ